MKLHGQSCCPSHKYQLGAFGQIHSHSSRNPMFGYLMGLSEVTQEDDVTAHLATAQSADACHPGTSGSRKCGRNRIWSIGAVGFRSRAAPKRWKLLFQS